MIDSRRQLENTKLKLRELEALYADKAGLPGEDRIRALTLRSLRKRINQFKEEIARFESHANSAAPRG